VGSRLKSSGTEAEYSRDLNLSFNDVIEFYRSI
jgi:hypothetical protein